MKKPSLKLNITKPKLPEISAKSFWSLLVTIKDMFLKGSYLWVILLFAFLARMYRVGDLGVSGQELDNIKRILSMDSPMSFIGGNACTNLYYLLQNFWGKMFGYSILNMRMLSVLLSLLGIFIFFKFTEEWFNRKLAYIATFLFSISSFHILLSRSVSHEVLYPVIIFSALHFLTLAYRYRMWQYFLLSGVFLGLGFYSSEITFVLVLVFIVSGFYFYSKNRSFFTSFIKEKAVFIVSAGIVSLPFFYSVVTSPKEFLSNFTYKPDVLLDNARNLVSSIVYAAPQEYMFNIGTDRVFDPFILVTFLLGLIYIVMRIKRRKFYFLVTWFGILTLIIIFKSVFTLGSFIYIAPIIFIMSARIQLYVIDKWFKTFPFNKFARIIMVLGIGFLFSLSLSYNFQKVFLAWTKYPERKFTYNTSPTSDEITKNKVYLYNSKYNKDVLASVMRIKNKDSIFLLSDLKSIQKDEKPNIITSPGESFKVKSELKDISFKESKGQDIILLKGE
ncbi:MAG: glycosyltransferase family 39 protein [bacterium]|nr:glycosyltransferase family 39 protein [bacterium]